MGVGARLALGTLTLWCAPRWAAAEQTVTPITATVPMGGPDHFFVDFDVPAGTVEIEVRHAELSGQNVLDWGLQDPAGFRGWGGGNSEPAIVGIDAASRSYTPGPIPAGTWQVVVGKAQIDDPMGQYSLEIICRDTPTLAPQPQRMAYAPAAALSGEARWYAGDVHVHSVESGDARPDLDEIATFARARGLDFVVISDHNVHTSLDFFVDAQSRHPDLLLVPGVEFTTYDGHVGGIGATTWVDHKIGQPGVTIEAAAQGFAGQSAVFTVNHPVLDLGALCIGCAWTHRLDPSMIGAVEIATGGLDPFAAQFSAAAIQFWDDIAATGVHVSAVGGSDDHRAGVDLNPFQSPIGDATTMVFADELSAAAIVAGIREGRTVVKLQGPADPMIELAANAAATGDTVVADVVTLRATITGAGGHAARLVQNGQPGNTIDIVGDPADLMWDLVAPETGEDRVRVEVLIDGEPRVVSGHLYLQPDPAGGGETGGGTDTETGPVTGGPGTRGGDAGSSGDGGQTDGGDGCGCTTDLTPTDGPARVGMPWPLLPLFALRRRKRR